MLATWANPVYTRLPLLEAVESKSCHALILSPSQKRNRARQLPLAGSDIRLIDVIARRFHLMNLPVTSAMVIP
jgi:hypothetical protein